MKTRYLPDYEYWPYYYDLTDERIEILGRIHDIRARLAKACALIVVCKTSINHFDAEWIKEALVNAWPTDNSAENGSRWQNIKEAVESISPHEPSLAELSKLPLVGTNEWHIKIEERFIDSLLANVQQKPGLSFISTGIINATIYMIREMQSDLESEVLKLRKLYDEEKSKEEQEEETL